jgi:hypothetical protein
MDADVQKTADQQSEQAGQKRERQHEQARLYPARVA